VNRRSVTRTSQRSRQVSVGCPPTLLPLLRAVVGLYCDPRQDIRVRDNIKQVATYIWSSAPDSARGEIGLKYANYAANADVDRKRLAHEFLDIVGGLTYLAETDLALEIQDKITRLESAHDAWDNFHNEPPLARLLRKFIPETGKIPSQVNDEYVRVLVRCRVGRTTGVSRNAEPIYEELLNLFDEPQIKAFVLVLGSADVTSRLHDAGCAARFLAIVTKLNPKTVNQPLRRVLAAINAATPAQLPVLWKDTRFQRLVAAV
jgi:hypothetical protein